jgi:hypothetical protein
VIIRSEKRREFEQKMRCRPVNVNVNHALTVNLSRLSMCSTSLSEFEGGQNSRRELEERIRGKNSGREFKERIRGKGRELEGPRRELEQIIQAEMSRREFEERIRAENKEIRVRGENSMNEERIRAENALPSCYCTHCESVSSSQMKISGTENSSGTRIPYISTYPCSNYFFRWKNQAMIQVICLTT